MGTLQNELKKLSLFVKFTKEEYVNDILDGNLYMNNFKYFIDLEKKKRIKGQGDKFEAAFVTRAVDLRIIDPRTKKSLESVKEQKLLKGTLRQQRYHYTVLLTFPMKTLKF